MLPLITKKIRVYKDRVQFLDPELRDKVDKINLSPSFVDSFISSPADSILDKLVLPDVQIKEPIYFARGTWFHSIMEDYFDNEKHNRNPVKLRESLDKVSKGNPEYKELLKDSDNKDWIVNCCKGLLKIDKQYKLSDKEVAKVYYLGESRKGLELFVKGDLPDVSRPVLGYVDCVFVGDNGFEICDWKTGKYREFDPKKYWGDFNSFSYWRQQILYTVLLELAGFQISTAYLVYPVGSPATLAKIPVNDMNFREAAIKDVKKADSLLTECIENDYSFPFYKYAWNNWGSYLVGMGNAAKPMIDEDKFLAMTEMKI